MTNKFPQDFSEKTSPIWNDDIIISDSEDNSNTKKAKLNKLWESVLSWTNSDKLPEWINNRYFTETRESKLLHTTWDETATWKKTFDEIEVTDANWWSWNITTTWKITANEFEWNGSKLTNVKASAIIDIKTINWDYETTNDDWVILIDASNNDVTINLVTDIIWKYFYFKLLTDISQLWTSTETFKADASTIFRIEWPANFKNKAYRFWWYNDSSYMSSVEVYDPSNDTWTSLASMPKSYWIQACAWSWDYIYVIWWWDWNAHQATNRRYDIVNDSWSSMSDFPISFAYWEAIELNDEIYVFGGHDGDPLDTAYKYIPSTDSYTQLANMPKTLYNLWLATINNKIYIIGWYDWNNVQDTIYEYDPDNDTYTQKTNLLTLRSDFNPIILNEKIYIIGWTDWNAVNLDVEVYNPSSDTIKKIAEITNWKYWSITTELNWKIYLAWWKDGNWDTNAKTIEYLIEAPWDVTINWNIEWNTSYEFQNQNETIEVVYNWTDYNLLSKM